MDAKDGRLLKTEHAEFNQEYIAEPINPELRDHLLRPELLKDYFEANDYLIRTPKSVCNRDKDTVFTTAGIQGILQDFYDGGIRLNTPVYVAQPVIRTQYLDSLGEGCSVCFTNISTSEFGNTFEGHQELVEDWMRIFSELGIDTQAITYRDKAYSRMWGDQLMTGYKVFYYYHGLELGDSTYFDSVIDPNGEQTTMSDVGFGLERLRWLIGGGSYYDLGVSREERQTRLTAEEQALCSGLALLAKDGVRPSNKQEGYRFRQFSKKLISSSDGNNIEYIAACLEDWLDYWSYWSTNSTDSPTALAQIYKENERNMNRDLLDRLSDAGCSDGQNIDINLPREEFLRRLANSSAVEHLALVL